MLVTAQGLWCCPHVRARKLKLTAQCWGSKDSDKQVVGCEAASQNTHTHRHASHRRAGRMAGAQQRHPWDAR